MLKKKFILLLIILNFSYGCGYTPAFKNMANKNLKIEITKIVGDDSINSYIITKLKIYSINDSNSLYKIKISNNYGKKDLSKDATGKVTNYELKLKVEFDVSSSSLNKKIIVEDNFSLKNLDDTYKNNQNEDLIKKEFSNRAVEKLISELIYFQ